MSFDRPHFEQLSTSREAGNVCSSFFTGRNGQSYTGLTPAWKNFLAPTSPNTGGPNAAISPRRSTRPDAISRPAPSRSRHGGQPPLAAA